MTIFQALLLGALQGLTEFLPVSSSGHLVLAEHLLKIPSTGDISFEVFVHFGTFLSVIVVFWNDIVGIFRSVFHAIAYSKFDKQYYETNEHFRLALCILLGSIPAGIVGVLYEHQISETFTDPKLVASMLVVTGLLLFLTRLAKPIKDKNLGLVSAFVIGLAQACAVIPGISRTGSTVSTALYLRTSPVNAARFSFLLSLPVIAGATLLKTKELIMGEAVSRGWLPLLVGTAVAFVTGYGAIKLLLQVMQRGKFQWFALYCLVVGVLGILFIG